MNSEPAKERRPNKHPRVLTGTPEGLCRKDNGETGIERLFQRLQLSITLIPDLVKVICPLPKYLPKEKVNPLWRKKTSSRAPVSFSIQSSEFNKKLLGISGYRKKRKTSDTDIELEDTGFKKKTR